LGRDGFFGVNVSSSPSASASFMTVSIDGFAPFIVKRRRVDSGIIPTARASSALLRPISIRAASSARTTPSTLSMCARAARSSARNSALVVLRFFTQESKLVFFVMEGA
jgi:hypothetical protein